MRVRFAKTVVLCICSVSREFKNFVLRAALDQKMLHAVSKGSDQTTQVHGLIFVGCKSQWTHFLMVWFTLEYTKKKKKKKKKKKIYIKKIK